MNRLPRISYALLAAAMLSPPAFSQVSPGTVQTVPVITLSLNVGNMEKEVRRVVYAPPPGWHIRSHRVECPTKSGLASYTVNTVPADWTWSSVDAATEAGKISAAGGMQAHGFGGEAKFVSESRKMTVERQRTTVSHHALVVEAAAHGSGFLGKGAALELTVYAELVYVGAEKASPSSRPPLLKPVPIRPGSSK